MRTRTRPGAPIWFQIAVQRGTGHQGPTGAAQLRVIDVPGEGVGPSPPSAGESQEPEPAQQNSHNNRLPLLFSKQCLCQQFFISKTSHLQSPCIAKATFEGSVKFHTRHQLYITIVQLRRPKAKSSRSHWQNQLVKGSSLAPLYFQAFSAKA